MRNHKTFPSLVIVVLILATIWYSFHHVVPSTVSDLKSSTTTFSTFRALNHVKQIAKAPHFLGSDNHYTVQRYITEELHKMGLTSEIQEGYTTSKTGILTKPRNIISVIKGTGSGKSLLLLSHYDSSAHSALGASDCASGIATLLEGIRAFLAKNIAAKNDIILLFSDAEELGQNGAQLFVQQHPLAKNIGLALNFEARGTAGSSVVLIETNGKNKKLLQAFSNQNIPHSTINSLAYSVYKIMPNDTDLSVFREQGNINGYNFAFIDNHFNYHTANDTWKNLDLKSLEQQGQYLMNLLPHFSNIDLDTLHSTEDYNYFQLPPFGIISYPMAWNGYIISSILLLFISILVHSLLTTTIEIPALAKSLGLAVLALLGSLGVSFIGWYALSYLYPEYGEIIHGFTYNGYDYIATFVFLSLAICFRVYRTINPTINPATALAPIVLLWTIVCGVLVIFLPGAGYFSILSILGTLSFSILLFQKSPNPYLLLFLSIPSVLLLSNFVQAFPVALGLKFMPLAAFITVFIFLWQVPLIYSFRRKKWLQYLCCMLAVIFFLKAHWNRSFTAEHPKPNSLIYLLDANKNEAVWATYDKALDPWTKNYIETNKNIAEKFNKTSFASKYGTQFSFVNRGPLKNIVKPKIEITTDTLINKIRTVEFCISSGRPVNRIDIYTPNVTNLENLKANGCTTKDFVYKNGNTYNASTKRWDRKLLSYYPIDSEPLELSLAFKNDSISEITVYETAFDLLENSLFSIPKRTAAMIPKPFVINDAIIVKKTIALNSKESK